MGIVEEISTIWPGAVFGHIPTSGKLAEIPCNCMPLISQYKCYTNGALSGMCRPEEHSSSHPQQCKTKNLKKMRGLPWIHKSIGFRRWDVHFAQTWFLWCMHLIWASRPCKKLCHTIVRSIESYWRPAGRKNLRAASLYLNRRLGGNPGFCRTSTTRKLGFFFRILPSIKELMATANLGEWSNLTQRNQRKNETKHLSSKRDCWIHTLFFTKCWYTSTITPKMMMIHKKHTGHTNDEKKCLLVPWPRYILTKKKHSDQGTSTRDFSRAKWASQQGKADSQAKIEVPGQATACEQWKRDPGCLGIF